MSAPVAITGLGAVSGFGWGVPALWDGLLSGRTAIGNFRRFDHTAYRTHVAAEVPALPTLSERRDQRLTLADRFALAAAAEALAGARLPAALGPSAGLFFGSSTGGMLEAEDYFAGLGSGRPRARIAALTAQGTQGPGDAVARTHGITGPVMSVASACSSATLALGSALEALRSGEVDLALAGGSDSLCRLTFGGFNALRAVDERPCRPFRLERLGMSIGEGAAVLVLESRAHAERRGARVLGWLAGAGASCDAHHMTSPDPGGEGITDAVRAALSDAGLAAKEIDFVNLHGTGTVANDAAEAAMLRRLFGERERPLPATSSKACVGHYLGAAGAVEALITLLCLEAELVHPTPGEGRLDPALEVDLVLGSPRPVPGCRRALSTNLAFGGANAACILLHREAV